MKHYAKIAFVVALVSVLPTTGGTFVSAATVQKSTITPGSAPSAPNQPPPKTVIPAIQVIAGDRLTTKQFKALPDTAVIELQGQRYTKLQIMTLVAQRKPAVPPQANVAAATDQFAALRASVDQAQKSSIAAANGQARSIFEQAAPPTPSQSVAPALPR